VTAPGASGAPAGSAGSPRRQRGFAGDLGRLGLLAIAGVLVAAAYTSYRIWEQGGRDERRTADAIVVMGAAQYDGRPSELFESRLRHAVNLFNDGLAPILVVTGGKQEGDRTTEAAVAREFAIRNGVPEASILSENQGRNTIESVRSVGRLFREHDLARAVFVSDPSHMLRVLRIASDEGIEAYGSPTPSGPNHDRLDARIDAMAHELAALGLYFVSGVQPADDALAGDEE
jgi:uncharacterized SAM-binding protein YcdF (DUF218 family)